MPEPHHSVFTCQMPFLPPNQQRQITEGTAPAEIFLCNFLAEIAQNIFAGAVLSIPILASRVLFYGRR